MAFRKYPAGQKSKHVELRRKVSFPQEVHDFLLFPLHVKQDLSHGMHFLLILSSWMDNLSSTYYL